MKCYVQSFKCIARLYFYSAFLLYNLDFILLWNIFNAICFTCFVFVNSVIVSSIISCNDLYQSFIIMYLWYFVSRNSISVLGAIWPSLSPCTVINPIFLTYSRSHCGPQLSNWTIYPVSPNAAMVAGSHWPMWSITWTIVPREYIKSMAFFSICVHSNQRWGMLWHQCSSSLDISPRNKNSPDTSPIICDTTHASYEIIHKSLD